MIEVLARMRVPIVPTLPDEVARKADIVTGATPDYSLSSIDTAVKWVDGSPVLRRVLITLTGTALSTPNEVGHILDFDGLVRLEGYAIAADGFRYPIGYMGGTMMWFSAMIHENGTIIEMHANAALSGCRMIIIIDYLGEPTTVSSWDAGTASWDNGGTIWDSI
ncbi:MAG: hypothetical protein C5B60_00070 [Chloroflexi bacterium]|nr:MAG: hypothetical protein C5B60_00070 [Chloroflexota bacterium]